MKMKKLIASILCFCMLFSLLPTMSAPAWAEEDEQLEEQQPEEQQLEEQQPEEQQPEEQQPEEQQPEGQQPEEQQPEGQQPEGQQPEGQQPEGQQPEGQQPEGQQPEGQQPEGQQPEGQQPEEQSGGHLSVEQHGKSPAGDSGSGEPGDGNGGEGNEPLSPTVTVTFDANGGYFVERATGNNSTVVSVEIRSGEAIGAAFDQYEIRHDTERMLFNNWSLSANGEPLFNSSIMLSAYVPGGDVTLYALWAYDYCVTLDANGGWFYNDTSMTSLPRYTSTGDIWLSDVLRPMKDDGTWFSGWYDADQTYVCGENGEFHGITEDMTLYAGWEQASWISVTLDANGGYFDDDETLTEKTVSVAVDKANILPEPDNSDQDVYFTGWYSDAQCEPDTLVCARNYGRLTPDGTEENMTLYAGWAEVSTNDDITVTFNASGGTIKDLGTASTSVVVEKDSLFPGNAIPTALDANNVETVYWYADPSCTGTRIDFNCFRPQSDVTLYAGWKEEYTVTLDANGGVFTTFDNAATLTVKVPVGEPVMYDPGFYCAEWTGAGNYRPNGWNTAVDGSGIRINLYSFIPEEDTTLYVHWLKEYKLNYNANSSEGGYFIGEHGQTDTLSFYTTSGDVNCFAPQNDDEHMRFTGWYADASHTGSPLTHLEFSAFVNDEATVYAGWEYRDLVTVVFDANDGYLCRSDGDTDGPDTLAGLVFQGIPMDPDQILQGYKRVKWAGNYLWDGNWYLTPACDGDKVDFSVWVPQDASTTLYAKKVPAVTVIFSANGGYLYREEWETEGPETVEGQVFKGLTFDPTDILDGYGVRWAGNYVHDGGWYLTQECDGARVDFNIWTPEEASTTLYAKKLPTVTFTLNANGGYFGDEKDDCYEIEVTRAVGEETYLSVPKNSDGTMVFTGWYYDSACQTLAWAADSYEGFIPAADTPTLYAGWEEGWIITFNSQGGTFWGDDGHSSDTCTRAVRKGGQLDRWNIPIPHYSDGMVLEAWCTRADCAEGSEIDRENFWPESDMTLWARKAESVTITFKANGGYFGSQDYTTEYCSIAKGARLVEAYGYVGTPDVHFGDGLVFDAWYTDPSCTGDPVDIDNLCPQTDMTLYAGSTQGVKITFIAGGTGGHLYWSGGDRAVTELFPMGRELRWNPNVYWDDNSALGGWYLYDADVGEPYGDPVELSTFVPMADTTFYAKPVEGARVTFIIENGHIYGASGPSAETVTMATGRVVDWIPYVEWDDGYALGDWYLYDEVNGAPIGDPIDLGTYVIQGNVTFYATSVPGVRLTYIAVNGHLYWEGGDSREDTFAPIGAILSDIAPRVYWDNGMALGGWYKDADFSEYFNINNYELTAEDNNLTLYAKPVPGVTITFNGNGGLLYGSDGPETESFTIPKGSTLRESGFWAPQSVYFEGHWAFNGWFKEASCKTPVTGDVLDLRPTKNTTLYAGKTAAVLVTFIADGGHIYSEEGPSIYTKAFPKNGSVEGWWPAIFWDDDSVTFEGWYLSSEWDPEDRIDTFNFMLGTEDVTLYAKSVPSARITFIAQGGHLYEPDGESKNVIDIPLGDFLGNWVPWEAYWDDGRILGDWYLYDEDSGGPIGDPIDVWNYVVDGQKTFCAKPVQALWITFDANGGWFVNQDGSRTSTFTVPVAVGSSFFLDYDRSPKKTNAHQVVDAWYYNASCTEFAFSSSEAFDVLPHMAGRKEVTLYAHWTAGWLVTFNANASNAAIDGVGTRTKTIAIVKGRALDYHELAVRWDGTYHNGSPNYLYSDSWYTKASCTGTRIEFGSYTPTGDVTLYAGWKATYEVILDANGGRFADYGPVAPPIDVPVGEPLMLYSYWFDVEWAGPGVCVPAGWNTKADGSGEYVSLYDFIPTEDTRLYRQWRDAREVTLDANGGFFRIAGEQQPVYVTTGDVTHMQPQREGNFSFSGWNKKDDEGNFTPVVFPLDDALFVDGRLTLYAEWAEYTAPALALGENSIRVFRDSQTVTTFTPTETGFYRITSVTNGLDPSICVYYSPGEGSGNGYGWTNYGYGDDLRNNNPKDFRWCHHEMLDAGEVYRVALSAYGVLAPTDITVIVEKVEGHTVTFDGNGGIDSNGSNVVTELVPDGEYVWVEPSFVIEDYRNKGWLINSSDPETAEWIATVAQYPITEDLTFYASMARMLTVTFHANGGCFDDDESQLTSQGGVYYGELIPTSSFNPSHSGEREVFAGWYFDPDCTQLACRPGESFRPVKNVTLYAKWEAGWRVTFDVNYVADEHGGFSFNGEPDGPTTEVRKVRKGSALEYYSYPYSYSTDPDNNSGMNDLELCGWRVNDPVKGKLLTLEQAWTYVPKADVTLYAQYNTPVYFKLDPNGGTVTLYGQPSERCGGMTFGATLTPSAMFGGDWQIEPPEEGLELAGWYYDPDCTRLACKYDGSVKLTEMNTTLYAKWVPAGSYTVVFDLNGLDDVPPYFQLEQEISLGYRTELVWFSTIILEGLRPGYQFAGWNTKANGSGTSYANGAKVLNLAKKNGATVTLYAVWKANKYTFAFNANGGTGKMSNQTMAYNKETALTVATFKKTGYYVAGWSTDPNATLDEMLYRDGKKLINEPYGNGELVTLYAVWAPISYRVVYDGNGGIGYMGDVGGYCYYDHAYALPANGFTRNGFDFLGWNTKADGSGSFVNELYNLSSSNGAKVTLYATWSAHRYNIRFDANGGTTGTMADMNGLRCGKTYTLKSNAFKLTGYVFLGWSLTPDGEVIYKNSAKVTDVSTVQGETVTLYAVWQAAQYTITYKNMVSADINPNPDTYTINDGFMLLEPTRAGWIFDGWYGDANYKRKIESIDIGTTGNKTIFAKWRPDPDHPVTYSIRFDPNGGTTGSMADMTGLVSYKNYNLRANTFKCAGYTFLGWSTTKYPIGTDIPNDAVIYKNKAKVSFPGNDVTLYAVWQPITYVITYKNVNAVLGENELNPLTYTVVSGEIVLEPPTRPGCRFVAWHTSSKFTEANKITSIPEGSIGNMTLYAEWDKDTTVRYKIVFEPNGENLVSPVKGKMSALTGRVNGTAYALPAVAFKCLGYNFVGWSLTPDGGADYANKAKVGNLTDTDGDTVTLYAVWEPVNYTITYYNLSDTEKASLEATYNIEDGYVLPDLTRNGYVFEGWYTAANLKEAYRITEIPVGKTGNISLYAKWRMAD